MTDLKSLTNRRKTLKGNLTRAKSFVASVEQSLRLLGEIPHRMKLEALKRKTCIEPWLDEFESIQGQIEEQDAEADDEAAQAIRNSFEDAYYEVLTKLEQFSRDLLNVVINNSSNSAHQSSRSASVHSSEESLHQENSYVHSQRNNHQTRVKLPQISLPTFSGQIEQWLNFRDMFTSLIHGREDIAEIEKFQYLKAALTGDAASIVQTIPLSTANYNIAWDTLKRRFENKPQIINNHLKSIFELECIPRESHVLLQSLLNTVMTNLSSLKALDQPTQHWDAVIIYLVRSKLDLVTKREWEKVRSDMSELPTLTDFTAFLVKKCQLLESLHAQSTTSRRQNPGDKTEKVKAAHVAMSSYECKMCKGHHAIYRCPTFLEMTPVKRVAEISKHNICGNCLRHNHKAKDCKSSKCRQCDQLHNTLLHLDRSQANTNTATPSPAAQTNPDWTSANNVSCGRATSKHTFLPTALVYVTDAKGNKHEARVLLDSGSQANFVRRSLIAKLGIKPRPNKMMISGINNSTSQSIGIASITLHSRVNAYKCKISCFVLDNITSNIPQANINIQELQIPNPIRLADPSFSEAGQIDILIGVEIFWSLLCTEQISLGRSQPTLQETLLGWVVSGSLSNQAQGKNYSCFTTIADPYLDINKQLAGLWQIQEVPEKPILTVEEAECERLFQQTTVRNNEGRFIVKLPFKDNVEELGSSFHIARRRFMNIERRLLSDKSIHLQYSEVIQEYIRLGHATEVIYDATQLQQACFLPHHAVVRPDKVTTKLRVVFDASCKTDSGKSLNDTLMVGPVVQSDIFTILVQFRLHRVAAVGDCEKMYRQILVQPQDRIYQNIVWRDDANSQLKTFQLNTVSFGTSAAPYLATKCIQQIAVDNAEQHPETSTYIRDSFYVDDFIASFKSENAATEILNQVNTLLRNYGFSMRKWASNRPQILEECSTGESRIHLGEDSTCRTLGLDWNAIEDVFYFPVNVSDTSELRTTKRTILSVISSIFDPLGVIGPIVVKSKIILQRLWQINMSWDETVPIEIYTIWCSYHVELAKIPSITIPRQVLCDEPISIQLHAFSDASEVAYGTCIYLRSTDSAGQHTVNLLCSKGRVAPLKTITIPRLELMAAQLAAKLVTKLKSTRVSMNQIFYWCDSSIVLAWLRKPPSELKTFVAHRITDITSQTEASDWHHIRSGDNPADLLSRGTSTDSLLSSPLWWHGPAWLSLDSTLWPMPLNAAPVDLPDVKVSSTTLTTSVTDTATNVLTTLIQKNSSLIRLQRILAYVFRFKGSSRPGLQTSTKTLSVTELEYSLQCIIKHVQLEAFAEEMSALTAARRISPSNRLSALNPFIDDKGLLRVGGRIRQSELPYNTKFPIVLPKSHPFTDLVIWHYHNQNLHAGAHATLNATRQSYWILSGKRTVSKITRSCVRCRRFNARPQEPMMGDLPRDRITPSRPFSICGTDFAGPFFVRSASGRGSKTSKAYLCLFICFATTAVHLELVTSLTTDAFLGCLERFIARRGLCKTIYSDNGTNFVGASNQIKELVELLSSQSTTHAITDYLSTLSITWKFIPARSPTFGGLWESAVKSAKRHLHKITGDKSFTCEELNTLFCQIESVMNSRPLIPVPSQPNDLPFLTPGHFLIGDNLQALPEPDMLDVKQNRLTRFQLIRQLHQQFWRSWSRDYLNLLQARSKWQQSTSSPVKIGDIVLLKEPTPPLLWRMGRVAQLHPGEDGVVRVITVRVSTGEMKRAVTKVVTLLSE